jgi:ABC-2 type transport system permease protein
MLFEYGARVNYNLIADLNCATIPVASGMPGQQTQLDMAPWLYYPILNADTASSLVKNLDGIRTEFVSTVDTISVPNIKHQVLFQTSAYHKIFETPKMLSLQFLNEQPSLEDYLTNIKPVAVLLTGSFKNVFLNRPIPEGIKEDYNLPSNSKATKMIVIGDGDVFSNQVSKTDQSPFPLGVDRFSQQNYGNKSFLLNIADDFTDENNLISLRNKEIKLRLLDQTLLRTEKTKWQLINSVLPLVLLICFAIFQHYYRKYKYTK